MAAEQKKSTMTRRERTALLGLPLPLPMVRRLDDSGIYCDAHVWLVRQKQAGRYVIRGRESGGSVAELGAYCGFVSANGAPLEWLQRIETIGVNRMHALVVASSLVRIHVARVLHTYDLLITQHEVSPGVGDKPKLTSSILFRGWRGTLELELWGKDSSFRGKIHPIFYNLAGERSPIPEAFEDAVCRAVAGVTCCGCVHPQMLVPQTVRTPDTSVEDTPEVAEAHD